MTNKNGSKNGNGNESTKNIKVKYEFTFDVIVDGDKKRKSFIVDSRKEADELLLQHFGEKNVQEISRVNVEKNHHMWKMMSDAVAEKWTFNKTLTEKLTSLANKKTWWAGLTTTQQMSINRVVVIATDAIRYKSPNAGKSAKIELSKIKSKSDADQFIAWMAQNDDIESLLDYAIIRDDENNVTHIVNDDDEQMPFVTAYVFGGRKQINKWIDERNAQ